jgi:serine/threonine protein kinase
MSHSPGGHTLSLSAVERHDRICDRFEAAWRAGSPLRIEDLLPEVPEDERPALFVQLLRVERDYRAGDPGAGDDYRARFPAHATLIDLALDDPIGTGPFLPGLAPGPPAIPGYEFTGTLGEGGMGVVFRARDIDLDRPVAIKMVLADVYDRPDRLLRFHLEACAAAGLSHANIVPIFDFGQADGRPYLVMELVEGGSLADRLKAGPADPAWAAGVVEQVARAVHHIHAHRLIHRDLKPANVLLTTDGNPKVTDFGLAKRLAGDDPRLTDRDTVVGTACYMSPEQARGGAAALGPATDVYALGAILYECLTGRPPFCARTYALTLTQVLTEDPRRPADLVPGLPADLEAVALKCLEKDPARRYPAAAEVADDLARFLRGESVHARPQTTADVHARWADRAGFKLGEPVGAARGAVTYRARQVSIGRTVRLKLAADPAARAALRHEAEAMAGLDHPNVVRLYDYSEQFGQPYLVLEDLDGRSLADAHPEPARQVALLGLRLALGVQAIHDNGFMHLGLWTGAVELTRAGDPKVGEFAAARRPGDPPGPDPDWVPVAFQSPEVRAGDRHRVGRPADFYAFGAILHQLLYGRPPETARPTRNRTDMLPELDEVVRKCLAPDPADRYHSAEALLMALEAAYRSGGSTIGDPGEDRPTGYRLRVVDGPKQVGHTFPVPPDRLIVGRGPESHTDLSDQRISRHHCAILWDAEANCHEVIDLGSHNGTFVNGRKVRGRRRLTAGDRLRVGDTKLVFELIPVGTD